MAPKYGTAVFVLLMLLAVPAAAQEAGGLGRFRVGLIGVVTSGDSANPTGPGPTLGGSPTFDLEVGRGFFVGIGPQASAKLQTSASNSSTAVVLDLLFRLGRASPLSERVHLYWYLAPGYSVLFTPNRTFELPSVGAHIGGALDLGGRVFATLQFGYQISWILDLGDSVAFLRRPGMAVGLLMRI
jgi:hypothetical protein